MRARLIPVKRILSNAMEARNRSQENWILTREKEESGERIPISEKVKWRELSKRVKFVGIKNRI